MFGGNSWAKQQLGSCLQFGGIELSSLGCPFLSCKRHRLRCIVFIGMSLRLGLNVSPFLCDPAHNVNSLHLHA